MVIVHARVAVAGSVTSESQTRPQKAVKEVAWAIVMKRDGTPGPRAEKGPTLFHERLDLMEGMGGGPPAV